MGSKFLITGADSPSGRLSVSCSIAFALKVRGLRVGVMKPAETGCAERKGRLEPLQTIAVIESASSATPLELACPYRYRAPLAPAAAAELDGSPPPDPDHLEASFKAIAAASDAIVVDGDSGLAVPISWNFDYAALAGRLALDVVLVVANRPDCFNGAAMAADYALRRDLRVRGFVILDTDAAPPVAADRTGQWLARMVHLPCLGAVRFKEPLGLKIIEQLL